MFTADDYARTELVYDVSKAAHRFQKRKSCDANGVPIRYFEHSRGTALILMDELGIADPVMTQALLLHDVPEDSKYLRERHIRILAGDQVAFIVRLLTKDPLDGYLDRLWTYGDWRVLVCKGCDRLYNLRDLAGTNEKFQRKQIGETREKYLPLFRHMVDITPAGPLRLKAQKLHDMIFAIVGSYETKWLNAPAHTP